MKRHRPMPALPMRPYRASWLAHGRVWRATIAGGTVEATGAPTLTATDLDSGRMVEADTPMECMDELARAGVLAICWQGIVWPVKPVEVPGNAGLYSDEPASDA